MLFACLGLGVSIAAHITSLMTVAIIGGATAIVLHLGALLLALLVAGDQAKHRHERNIPFSTFRKHAYPPHVRWVFIAVFIYTFVTFCHLFYMKWIGYHAESEVENVALAIRLFSTGWIFMYYISYEVSTASLRIRKMPRLECKFGHGIITEARCPICGTLDIRKIPN